MDYVVLYIYVVNSYIYHQHVFIRECRNEQRKNSFPLSIEKNKHCLSKSVGNLFER